MTPLPISPASTYLNFTLFVTRPRRMRPSTARIVHKSIPLMPQKSRFFRTYLCVRSGQSLVLTEVPTQTGYLGFPRDPPSATSVRRLSHASRCGAWGNSEPKLPSCWPSPRDRLDLMHRLRDCHRPGKPITIKRRSNRMNRKTGGKFACLGGRFRVDLE